MANKILVATDTTPIIFAANGRYADDGDLGDMTYDSSLDELTLGTAVQSAKADMDTNGVANRVPHSFAVTVRMEWGVAEAPVAGGTIDIYWAASLSSTAATANPGGTTGSSGGYTGTAGSTLAESLLQLDFIGQLVVTNDAQVLLQTTFMVELPTQYGNLVVVNNASEDVLAYSTEMAIFFTPYEFEAQ